MHELNGSRRAKQELQKGEKENNTVCDLVRNNIIYVGESPSFFYREVEVKYAGWFRNPIVMIGAYRRFESYCFH